ncbi:hypothetical protein KKB99_06320 [bacterium]|nr:hypothetical protein [bacterium]MBU1025603.1 hypothetical protein [bacterium]
MMKHSRLLSIMLLLGLVFLLSACSGGMTPVEPDTESLNMPESFSAEMDNRNIIAVYKAVVDPNEGTFEITPVERSGTQYHFPVNDDYPRALEITDYGWTPNFWADIKLIHPFPRMGIEGYDPRVIGIIQAYPDVSFNYPELNVVANNSVVLEQDGYTKLFDYLGFETLGNANPFKAYFKDQPNRNWPSTGYTEETQRWEMNFAGFGGPFEYILVVDVTTNYPNIPQLNSPEPAEIDATIGPGLTTLGGSAEINATLLDWQGQETIGGVLVEAPDLFIGTVSLSYSAPGPNPNEYVYTGTISNSLLAPEGEYNILVATWDQMRGIFMYNEFTVNVESDI